jgi:hypothetical protein
MQVDMMEFDIPDASTRQAELKIYNALCIEVFHSPVSNNLRSELASFSKFYSIFFSVLKSPEDGKSANVAPVLKNGNMSVIILDLSV